MARILPRVAEQIVQRRKALGWNTTRLAKEAGLSQSFMSKVERGLTSLSEDKLLQVAGALRVSAHVLFQPADANVELITLPGKPLPVLDYVQAGRWMSIKESLEDIDMQETLLASVDAPSSAFFLRVRGNSMEPRFFEGDTVLIYPTVSPAPGDFVVATDESRDATFKKYREIGINSAGRTVFELVALNPDYGAMRSDQQPIAIVGTMVEHRWYRKPLRSGQ